MFKILEVYPEGSDLFTSPNVLGVGRKFCGPPTKWPVAVVRVGPRPLGVTIPLHKWHSDVGVFSS